MTNNTNAERKLADVGDRISARASLYHVLLTEWAQTEDKFVVHADVEDPVYCCLLCFTTSRNRAKLDHFDHCLLVKTRRALAADDATIRALLADVNPPGGDA